MAAGFGPPSPEGAVAAIRESVVTGARSPLQIIDETFARAQAARAGADGLNAFLWSDSGLAHNEAAALEDRLRNEDAGSLAGVPIVVKDNIATLDSPTTCG